MSIGQERIFGELAEFAMCLAETLKAHHLDGSGEDDELPDTETIANLKKKFSAECCRRATGEEAARFMENFVNVMAHNEEEKDFAEKIVHGTHRTLNQSFFGLVFRCIAEEAKCVETGRYDARNEGSVKLCKKIMDAFGSDMYLPFI